MPEKIKPTWICTVCGFLDHRNNAPLQCPSCKADQKEFKIYSTPDDSASFENTKAPHRYLIIGSGIAGISAAESIRKSDPKGFIGIISSEHELPYFRMNLTRYLAGEVEGNKLALHPENWYEKNHVFLHQDSTVQEILPDEKYVVLTDNRKIPYDSLILAVGATPFIPPFEGSHLNNVLSIRTIHDTDLLLNACQECINVVCIGGGLLGLEIAGAINRRGARVTIIESLPWLLPRQLNKDASMILRGKIESMGIKVLTGAKTSALLGEESVTAVQLEDGSFIPADMVVISAGIHANTELACQAGLRVNRGIVVDDQMLTSHWDIYAVGDVTEHNGIVYGLWVPAKNQGAIGGMAATGKKVAFEDQPPSARLKVLGIDLFSIGQFTLGSEEDKLISESKDGSYVGFVFNHGKMVGSILLGDASLASYVKSAIEGQRDFSQNLENTLSVPEIALMLKSK